MKTGRSILFVLALCMGAPAYGQAAPRPTPLAPLAVPAPTYVTEVLEVTINRPAAEVWARIGRYCDIGEWLGTSCELTSGKDGELGAVRLINTRVVEMMVATGPLSYTYTQPVRVDAPFNAYHGTMEARPLTAKTSRLIYSFFWDNSMLADDAARAKDKTDRATRFTAALAKMKALVETDTPRP